ncbi:MAG: hypothetical protein KBD15_00830, partial [Candidatus Magasanikbacteria bacterium]|nr:hypothetical protein [Candidatus Magasanikbacteria bacterium]
MKTKIRLTFLLCCLFVQVFGVFFVATPASATGVPVFDASVNATLQGLDIKRVVEKVEEESFTAAVMGSLVHGAAYFTRRLAYDTAVYVASGGKGQNPLAFWQSGNDYISSTLGDALADSIGELGKPFGLNLCQIPDLQFQVFLQFGLLDLYGGTNGPQPNCTFQDLTNGGLFDTDAWKQRYGTEEGLAETFSAEISVRSSDFGIALGAIEQIDEIREQQKEAAVLERTEGEGFTALTDLITGNVKTPAQIIKEESSAVTAKHQGELSAIQTAGIYGSGLKQLPAVAASVFLNTLTSQLLNRLLTEGLFPSRSAEDNPGSAFSFFGSPQQNNQQRARNALTFLFTKPADQLSNYPILAEFASCPDNPGLNNCVIDSNLHQALSQAKVGKPLTIGEALESGKLNGSWRLIPPRHQIHQDIERCQVGYYCYSNVQKLRKLRVLPLGFEVAALRSDPESPWTLQEVVDGFEDCARPNPNDPTEVVADADHPFCHLINPNWVIALPDARCESNVIGPQLVDSRAAKRRNECVDISTCIAKDASGSCIDYGYCTKEKNVWNLGGDACPAEFSTCTTYTNTQNRSIQSYLARTIDAGECSIDTVGCRTFTFEQANNAWVTTPNSSDAYTAVGRNQNIHFNASILSRSDVCRPEADGCHAYYAAQRDTAGNYIQTDTEQFIQDARNEFYMQKAPDYLGCYDTNRAANSPEINWPTTLAQVQNEAGGVSQNEACNAFASVCIEDEVGCNAYRPLAGGPNVPGIIGTDNTCAQSCVGYDVFRQEETVFDSSVFPLYFIPSTAESCSQTYVGCDEFTNIDEASRGGEGLEYYTDLKYCERPLEDRSNVTTYYSWEGSLSEGLAIKTHRLRPITQGDAQYIAAILGNNNDVNGLFAIGSPAYADDSVEALTDYAARCNEARYTAKINDPYNTNVADNIDPAEAGCHAVYLNDGTVFYRLLSELITVDDACHPLRKTQANTFVDEAIPDALCTGRHGTLVDGECVRCKDGGTYVDGVCIYSAMTGENESLSCPAQFNGCRAYTGNTAGNIQELFNNDFEAGGNDPAALAQELAGWTPVASLSIVAEATDVGLHSLQALNGRATKVIPTTTPAIAQGQFFELSFWARGIRQNIVIRLRQNIDGQNVYPAVIAPNVSVGNAWQEYRFGPVQLGAVDPTKPLELTIHQLDEDGQVDNGINGRTLFLDHVRLTRVQDTVSLVKDSWKTREGFDVPLACDSNPQDGLPGEGLGCRAYEEVGSKGQIRYATGFEQLCREKAVGCQPVWDTYNTLQGDSPQLAHIYNLKCTAAAGQNCTIEFEGTQLGNCTVGGEQTACYVTDAALPATITFADLRDAGYTDASTVFVPQDTPTSTPIFLAYREEFACTNAELGCSPAGLEQQVLPDATESVSFTHADLRIKNDPNAYAETLCQEGLVGCTEFAHGSEISYFKDPKLSGNALCTYKQPNRSGESYGWFLDGVGQCAGSDTYCTENAQCGENGRCQNIGNIACYDNLLERGGEYGLWSNASDNYAGFVGMCPDQYNSCTELVDPQDTSNSNPEGKPYYVLFNQKMQSKLAACDQVSLRDGCVLFDKTDNPNKIFSSGLTYKKSEELSPPYGLTDPIRSNNQEENDTNILIQVERERACSEWLACRTSVPITTETGQTQQVCYQYQACDALGDVTACSSWVDDLSTPEDTDRALYRLTYDRYVERGVSWYDEELSGYSLYDSYQITNLIYLGFSFPSEIRNNPEIRAKEKETFIVREFKNHIFERLRENPAEQVNPCLAENSNWNICGFDAGGRCYSGKCLYPTNNGFKTIVDKDENGIPDATDLVNLLDELSPNICKGFPEDDSPYAFGVAQEGARLLPERDVEETHGRHYVFTQKRPGFSEVNVCQAGNCSCNYEKEYYQDGTVEYWPIELEDKAHLKEPSGICTGGDFEGTPCSTDSHCNPIPQNNGEAVSQNGTCSQKVRTDIKIGLEGFCLEEDLSRPVLYGEGGFACLTWLPIQASASNVDIYNNSLAAGYAPDIDGDGFGQIYCVDGTRASAKVYDHRYLNMQLNVNDPNSTATTRDYAVSWSPVTNEFVPCPPPPEGQNGQGGRPGACRQDAPLIQGCENPENANAIFCPARDVLELYAEARGAGFFEEGNLTRLYSYFQNYAWHNFNNAAVLRFEYDLAGHATGGNRQNEQFGVYARQENDQSVQSRGVYGFAPMVVRSNDFGATEEFGTIMHPPRRFSNNQGPFLGKYRQAVISRPEQNDVDDRDATIVTTAMSPEYSVRGEVQANEENHGAMQNGVYVSPFERQLNEFDIKKIHIVPFTYINFNNAEVPARLSDIQIDFELLRTEGAHVQELDDQREGNSDYLAWSYFLDEQDMQRFSRFTNYGLQSNAADIAIDDDALQRRNVIHHRYVVVTSDSNRANKQHMPSFMGVTYNQNRGITGATNPADDFQPNTKDPFQVPCGTDNSEWLAIGMDFNADGEFLGYITRWCSESLQNDDSVGIAFLTAAELVDHCTNVALVQNQGNPLRDILNKAWTNRVWLGARSGLIREEGIPQIFARKHPEQPYIRAITQDTPSKPFGSFAVLNSDFSNEFAIRKNTFLVPDNGIPYACTSPWLASRTNFGTLRRCQNLGTTYPDDVKLQLGTVAGAGIARRDGISQLFAEIFDQRIFEYTFADNGRITRNFVQLPATDVSQTVGEELNLMFPQVYATNPHACTQLKDCVAAEKNALTLNGRNGTMEDYNNDGSPDEDFDGNGTPDSFIGQASYYAVLSFFAFADDNRMPIRRVMVDWGDNSQVSDRMGLYQNRKPVCGGDDPGFADVGLCVDANNNPTGLTCDLGEAKKTCPTFDLNPAENQTCV